MKITVREDGSLLIDGENNTTIYAVGEPCIVVTKSSGMFSNYLTIEGGTNKNEIRNFVFINNDKVEEKIEPMIIFSELDPFGEEDWN